jgi:hypothetical protein
VTGSERTDVARLASPGLITLVLVVTAGLLVRTIDLGRLPGINGDEAWYGANVHLLLDGERPFWRTGIGNVVSPLHSGILIVLERLAGPSFTLLRVPSVLWGCLAVGFAYPLVAPLIGTRSAIILTAILALSPAAVSQARTGWDPSATVFLSLLTLAFAVGNRPWLCGASFLLALVAHPTNLFLAPAVATQWWPAILETYRGFSRRARRRILWTVALVLPPAGMIGWNAARTAAHAGFLPSLELVAERLTGPSAWYALGVGLTSLFSGVTSAAAIAGQPPTGLRLVANTIVLTAFAMAAVGCWRSTDGVFAPRMARLAGGLVVSIVAFHVVAGSRALEPGTERYAMFLLAPLAMLCSAGLGWLGRAGSAAGAMLCGMLAVVLSLGYFLPLASEGGRGHAIYRTGRVEPKLAAFEFANAHSRDAQVVAVFAEDWWLYWPIRYLAWHERRMHVEMLGDYDRWLVPPGGDPRRYERPPDRVYAVVFHGGEYWAPLRTEGTPLFTANDPIGRPIIDVIEVPPSAFARLRVPMPWQSRH